LTLSFTSGEIAQRERRRRPSQGARVLRKKINLSRLNVWEGHSAPSQAFTLFDRRWSSLSEKRFSKSNAWGPI